MTNIKKAHEVLESEFTTENIEFLNQERPSILRIILSIILCVGSYLVALGSFPKYNRKFDMSIETQRNDCFMYSTIFYISVFLCLFFFFDFVLIAVALWVKNNFLSLVLLYNRLFIKIIICLWGFFLCMAIIRAANKDKISTTTAVDTKPKDEAKKTDEEKEDAKKDEKIPETIDLNEQMLLTYVLAFSVFFVTILFMRIILQYVNYNIHYNYFRDRIDDNNYQVQFLLELNKRIPTKTHTDLKTWAGRLYYNLLRNEDGLCLDDFTHYFGEEKGEDMFSIFDKNQDNTVSKEEFVQVYYSIFREKKLLEKSIEDHDDSLSKLKAIFSTIFIPLAIFFSISTLGHKAAWESSFGSVLGIFLPVSFVFSAVLSEMFQSIIFVFGVRPFDIGDHIILSNGRFEVREMGLLYTLLYSDGRTYSFPNLTLRKENVINLRKSKFTLETIQQSYEAETAKPKLDDLKVAIKDFFNENNKWYRSDFNVCDFEFVRDIMKVKYEIKILVPYNDVDGLKLRKDKFVMFLHDKTLELGIKYKT